MSILDALRPTKRRRIYDLVRDAGIDVSDWAISQGKAKSAASNPKYCYRWSFVHPGEFVVLNLWFRDMKEHGDGKITLQWNARKIANKSKGVTIARANDMDEAIRGASQRKLPVRIVICEGTKRFRNGLTSNAARVSFRLLDPEPWHVASYDKISGACELVRGLGDKFDSYVDQFDVLEPPIVAPGKRKEVISNPFVRRPDVRRRVLLRARGKCEFCNEKGFVMGNGKVYLETHHIIPMHESGQDIAKNVAALCPTHHREAHFGKRKVKIRGYLLKRMAQN